MIAMKPSDCFMVSIYCRIREEQGQMKIWKKRSLKWKMVKMLLFGWLLPLLILTLSMLYTVSSMINRQLQKTILVSADKAVEICDMQLQEMVVASKNASYNGTIRESYLKRKRQDETVQYKKAINNFMAQQYKYDARILGTALFFLDDPEEVYYTYNTYQDNNTGNQSYQRREYFINHVQEKVMERGRSLDTGTVLMQGHGHLYLVRNLVDSSFTPYAMIVMGLRHKDIGGITVQTKTDDRGRRDAYPLAYHETLFLLWVPRVHYLRRVQAGGNQGVVRRLFPPYIRSDFRLHKRQ